ncbi:ubiquitin carboxyl-terminal hydrolase [Lipomyces kononenkoae]
MPKKLSARRRDASDKQKGIDAEIDRIPLSPREVLRQKLEYKGWGTIESDPSIFGSILKDAGVNGAKVVELYSLDADSLRALPVIFGLIFLFRWMPDAEDSESTRQPKKSNANTERENLQEPWFANQVSDNACASLALLNIVFNASSNGNESSLGLGEHLQQFREFTESFNPTARGMALADFEFLRQIHNQYAQASELRNDCVQLYRNAKQSKRKRSSYEEEEGEESFHFVAYVPVCGAVWELDGLRDCPIKVAEVGDMRSWPSLAVPYIQERISEYSKDEIRFNLMAMVPDNERDDHSVYQSKRAIQAGEIVLQTVERRLDMIAPDWEEIMPSGRKRMPLDITTLATTPNVQAEVMRINAEDRVEALIDILHTKEEELENLRSRSCEREITQAFSIDSTYTSRRKHDYSKFLRLLIVKCLQDDENKMLLQAACESRR